MQFEFATATRIIFGPGSSREIASLAKPFGSRALLVTGRNAERVAPIQQRLTNAGIACTHFAVGGEPTISVLQQCVALAKSDRCEFVVGIGGGSALDLGKAAAAMLTNPGDVLDYLEVVGRGQTIKETPAPYIAVPTTAGTGAEVTRNAVLASPEHKVKASLRSPLMLPRIALVDPELTFDLPPEITASTGLDALTQLIEPFVSCRANPMTDALCIEGMRRAARSLRTACVDGRNAAAREDMALASLFGGLALANAALGAVHGFAAPIGGMFPAPHGAVCAALLPVVMHVNLRALRKRSPDAPGLRRFEKVARILTAQAHATADDGIAWLQALVSDLNIPPLRTYGISDQHVTELVEKATKASSMKGNPIVLTREELTEALERSL